MYLDFNMIQMDARDESKEKYEKIIAQERAENARQKEYIAQKDEYIAQKDAYIAQLEKQLHLHRI